MKHPSHGTACGGVSDKAAADRTAFSLDTPFDQLTLIARGMFNCPIGLVSVLDGERAVFRSDGYFTDHWLPKELSVSKVLVDMGPGAVLVVEDATKLERFRDHPWVTGGAKVRFFAGTTICLADGSPIGALTVMDNKPRGAPSEDQLVQLKRLATIAGNMVDQVAAGRIQAEQLLLLKLTETVAGVGHWHWDIDRNQVTWSDEIYRICGVDRAGFELTPEAVMEAYHPDDRIVLAGLIDEAVRTGTGYECKLRLKRADGSERITQARAVCDRRADGRVHALFGLLQDVTDAETAYQQLLSSEDRYRLLADHSTDVIGTCNLNGVFSYMSPAVDAVLGYRPEEIIGRTFSEFVHPEDLDRTRQAYREYMAAPAGTPPPRIVYRAFRKSGELIWLEACPKLVRDEAGHPVEFQDRARDVTEAKRLETELIEARDKAEAGARAKSDFLSNMSHELRTPLTSVIGFSGLLKNSGKLGPEERRFAERISAGSEALLSVINDILDYSKLEAGAVGLNLHPFRLRDLLVGLVDLFEARTKADGLTLALDFGEGVPVAVRGDEGKLRQVILNLLSNAMKFTAEGGVTVTVEAITGDNGQPGILVEVTDTGIGISTDTAAALFDRFVQADTSTTRNFGGTGLGLAISRQLVEMMGGQIGARGVIGAGSTFWFSLPLEAVSLDEDVSDGTAGTFSLRSARILVADDVSANRELIAAILTGLGHSVTTVKNGAEAVEAALAGEFELILMDVQMPVLDGLDATRAIRRDPGRVAKTPIIALTANVEHEQVQRCREAGMDGHVGKPIVVARLVEALSGWLQAEPEIREASQVGCVVR